MAARNAPNRRRATSLARGWAIGTAVLGAALLSGCDRDRQAEDILAVGLGNSEHRHPIDFANRTEVLDVEVPENTEGLSTNQDVDVYRFLERYRRQANGRLVITVPGGPRDPASIAHSLKGIQRHVADAGIDYHIKRGPRSSKVDVPVIRVAYRRPVALPPVCDKWGENVARNNARVPYPNFGCATHHNTAVMIDNARDLIEPQHEDPRAGERRSVTWSAYVGTGGKDGGDSGGGGDAKKAPAPKK